MAIHKRIIKLIEQGDHIRAMWELCNVIEHDAHCWQSIADRAESGSYVAVFSKERFDCLKSDVAAIYEALIAKQRESKS
jgi:hypothetical protein